MGIKLDELLESSVMVDTDLMHLRTVAGLDKKIFFANFKKKRTITLSVLGPTDDLDVTGVDVIFIDTTANHVTLGGMIGGINGQVIHIIKVVAANNAILEHNEGTVNQDIQLHKGADETLDGHLGGWSLVNYGGGDWFDASHAQHV